MKDILIFADSIGSNGGPQRASSTKVKSHKGMFILITGLSLWTPLKNRMARG